VLERASDAFLNGLRAGIKELEDLEDSTTWEDLDELAADFNINLSALMDKYDAGELHESEDDDMFSSSTKLSKLKRMPTDTLMMLWNAIKDDNRPEYAEVHRQQKIRLGLALAGRGIYVPYPMGGAPVNLDEDINIPLGSQKGK
jgi:predicted DNA-binding ribbon-helix-helix protein